MSQRIHAFTFVDLIVVLAIISFCVMLALALPGLGGGRRTGGSRQMQNSTQIRGIHSGLVLYSQGNNGHYPGYDKEGKRMEDYSVEFRFQELLDDNYFTGEYIISPNETASKTAMTQTGIRPTADNFSYAMLNLSVLESPRNFEWNDTSNSEAMVLSDRALANGKDGALKSVHTKPKADITEWRGSVAFNDNHVTFEATHNGLTTIYGSGDDKKEFAKDNLFDEEGASLVYKGTSEIIDPGK